MFQWKHSIILCELTLFRKSAQKQRGYALSLTCVQLISIFLAIKYASAAMLKTNASRGKTESGGSIILTASGEYTLNEMAYLF